MTTTQVCNTKLHVIFVNRERYITKEVIIPCMLNRDCDIPHINFKNNYDITYVFDDYTNEQDMCTIPFYDEKLDRFNFKCSNLYILESNKYDVPDEIEIDILDVTYLDDDDDTCSEHVLLEPGLWKGDEDGVPYRICDDSMNHVILDAKVPELVKEFKNVKPSWKELFFTAFKQLNLILIPEDIGMEDDVDEDNEEDDDIEEFECDGDCENCLNTMCFDNPNHVSKHIDTDINDKMEYDENGKLLKNSYYGTDAHIKDDDEKDDNHYTKCDRCGHRKDCEKARAEFSTKKLYPEQMTIDDIDKTSLIPVKMIKINLKPSSNKRKHRKY